MVFSLFSRFLRVFTGQNMVKSVFKHVWNRKIVGFTWKITSKPLFRPIFGSAYVFFFETGTRKIVLNRCLSVREWLQWWNSCSFSIQQLFKALKIIDFRSQISRKKNPIEKKNVFSYVFFSDRFLIFWDSTWFLTINMRMISLDN